MENEVEFESPQDPLSNLEDQVRRDIEELIANGCLVDSFSFGGHSFVFKTLNAKEEWAAAKAIEPYRETLREPQVFMAAYVGLALQSVDGDPNFHISLNDLLSHAQQRLDYVGAWDTIVLDQLFMRYTALDKRRNEARVAITNLSSRSLGSFMPTPDSLTEPDTFSDAVPPGTPY